jgi:hypothetical protein
MAFTSAVPLAPARGIQPARSELGMRTAKKYQSSVFRCLFIKGLVTLDPVRRFTNHSSPVTNLARFARGHRGSHLDPAFFLSDRARPPRNYA